ncbi:hypothetical protein FE257_000106 [Aspergillus nanangensis]|uniref:Uncharacterized protein n=1 Tax=Aspergillus nanangensis TaxID=2582783 RepID=A0AAD4CYT6_ASPNN|nr:hypothetical protein FE257_000106 [Aspergillus nanangensis]
MRFIISMTIFAAISAAQTFNIHDLLQTPEEIAAYDDVVSRAAASGGHNEKLSERCCDFLSPCCNLDTCCESRDECYVNYCGLSNPAGGACALGCLTACPASPAC